jgi:hypothetical protein
MSPTLLEGAIAILLVWIAWRIGRLLAPWIARRFRDRPSRWDRPANRKARDKSQDFTKTEK